MAGKRVHSGPSLGTLFIAAQFIDLIWPLFLLAGLETVTIAPGNTAFTPLDFTQYPFTHSLLGVVVWAGVVGLVHFLSKRDRRSALLLSGLVLSHWLLDLVTHRPDLQVLPWQELRVGLGLWNHVAMTLLTEVAIFLVGAYLYVNKTRALNRVGRLSLWLLLAFLALVYGMSVLGPPPESAQQIAVVGFTQWLLVAWGYWIDRNRVPISV